MKALGRLGLVGILIGGSASIWNVALGRPYLGVSLATSCTCCLILGIFVGIRLTIWAISPRAAQQIHHEREAERVQAAGGVR